MSIPDMVAICGGLLWLGLCGLFLWAVKRVDEFLATVQKRLDEVRAQQAERAVKRVDEFDPTWTEY